MKEKIKEVMDLFKKLVKGKNPLHLLGAVVVIVLLFILIFSLSLDRGGIVTKLTERQAQYPELVMEDLRVGRGTSVEVGDTVRVHYVGMFEDGEVFDDIYESERFFEFTVGKSRMIIGWDVGLEGMKTGGIRKLTVPPHLGYGEKGVSRRIPPDSTLIYEIELLEIVRDE